MFNLAVVGLGRWGQRLVESVQGHTAPHSLKVRFTHAVVRDARRAETYAQSRCLTVSTDYLAVLKDPSIDGVVLATPHLQHEEQVLAAAEAQKHIFVEKPLTLGAESARRLSTVSRSRNITLALGHNRRFLPALNHMRQKILEGELGQFLHIEGNMSGNFALSYAPGNWRSSQQESPLGSMTAMGIHVIDAFLFLIGRISAVSTLSLRSVVPIEIDDTTSLLMKFERGGSGYLATVYTTAPTFQIQVFGTAGSAHLLDRDTLVLTDVKGDKKRLAFDHYDIERAELEAFVDAARGESNYPVSLEDGVHGIAVLDAAIQSSANGGSFESVQDARSPKPVVHESIRALGD